jgi:hypothetical protein
VIGECNPGPTVIISLRFLGVCYEECRVCVLRAAAGWLLQELGGSDHTVPREDCQTANTTTNRLSAAALEGPGCMTVLDLMCLAPDTRLCCCRLPAAQCGMHQLSYVQESRLCC